MLEIVDVGFILVEFNFHIEFSTRIAIKLGRMKDNELNETRNACIYNIKIHNKSFRSSCNFLMIYGKRF